MAKVEETIYFFLKCLHSFFWNWHQISHRSSTVWFLKYSKQTLPTQFAAYMTKCHLQIFKHHLYWPFDIVTSQCPPRTAPNCALCCCKQNCAKSPFTILMQNKTGSYSCGLGPSASEYEHYQCSYLLWTPSPLLPATRDRLIASTGRFCRLFPCRMQQWATRSKGTSKQVPSLLSLHILIVDGLALSAEEGNSFLVFSNWRGYCILQNEMKRNEAKWKKATT